MYHHILLWERNSELQQTTCPLKQGLSNRPRAVFWVDRFWVDRFWVDRFWVDRFWVDRFWVDRHRGSFIR